MEWKGVMAMNGKEWKGKEKYNKWEEWKGKELKGTKKN